MPRPRPTQYLLSLDGHTAAYRFATLLATNSIVLKQDSRELEWFYASARPWKHYIPILKTNRTDVLGALAWAEAHPEEVAAMVEAANRLALTYTTYHARLLYWVYSLHVYKSLFPDQEAYFMTRGGIVRDLVAEYNRPRGEKPKADAGGGGGDGGAASDDSTPGTKVKQAAPGPEEPPKAKHSRPAKQRPDVDVNGGGGSGSVVAAGAQPRG